MKLSKQTLKQLKNNLKVEKYRISNLTKPTQKNIIRYCQLLDDIEEVENQLFEIEKNEGDKK